MISEVRKPRPDPAVAGWFAQVESDQLYLSVLVLGEVRQGIDRLRRRDGVQAAMYERWLSGLQSAYSDRILPVTAAIAEEWGRLNVPDPWPVVDGLLAATAIVHGLTLVTRNDSPLAEGRIAIFNPWRFEREG